MADPSATRLRRRPAWHRLVEHYTPDGALGRSLFAAASGSACAFSFWIAALGIVTTGFLSTLVGLVALGATLGAALLAVITLWPVYLSLIGNVPSAAAYSNEGSSAAAPDEHDDPITALRHQYAVGEVSRDEFEQRLDDLLQVDAQVTARDTSSAEDEPDRLQETAGR